MSQVSFVRWLFSLSLLCMSASANADIQSLPISCGEGNETLYGTLLLPTHKVKPPVVLIISDAGAIDRDGNIASMKGKNDSLKMLAEELAIAGYATVRFDKRGVAESKRAGREEEMMRFQMLVADAESWLKQLSNDARFGAVGLIGHGEGASVAILAAKAGGPRALVTIAGVAQSASKILRAQLKGKFSGGLAQVNEDILSRLERGQLVDEVPAPLLPLYRPSVQKYLISWFSVVPKNAVAQLSIPVAVVQGDRDLLVNLAEAEALAAAAAKPKLIIVHGMNHILKDVEMDTQKQLESYTDPFLPLNQDLIKQVVSFLRTHLVSVP